MSHSYDISMFGQRLKELRKKRELTMQDLADCGIADRKTIGDWEHGKCVPELARVLDLCEALDCDFDYLFGKIDLPHKEETDICRETGLSEEAVEKLIEFNSASDYETGLAGLECRLAIELLILNPYLLRLLHEYFNDMTFWNIGKDHAYITIDRADGSQGVFRAETPEQRSLVRAINLNRLLECLTDVYNTNSNTYKDQYITQYSYLDHE